MGFDRLIARIRALQNPTVAGLDPKLSYVPEYIRREAFSRFENPFEAAAEAILTYNKGLIDALCDVVPAVKPQCAYYEMYGWQGMRTLAQTIAYAKEKGMFVITDGKRNDIGATMQAYAAAHLGETQLDGGVLLPAFDADALTVNGYLGTDGIAPLTEVCAKKDKGIFVLVKTSNPSSGELQDRLLGEEPVYRAMGAMCERWGEGTVGQYGYSAVGAVVGATYPQQLEELRAALPHTFFLVPGYGAQGGGAKDVAPAFDKNGDGAIINSSRGILCAYQKAGCAEHAYAEAARKEAIRMRDDIISAL